MKGSVAYPGNGALHLYEFHRTPDQKSLVQVANATYNATTLIAKSSSCTFTFKISQNHATSHLGDVEGIAIIKLLETLGAASCTKYTSDLYWLLWSAIGDVAAVPINVSPTDSFYTLLYYVTAGSTMSNARFIEIAAAKDMQITTAGNSSGIYSSASSSVLVEAGQCAVLLCAAPTVCIDPTTSRVTAQVPSS